MKYPVDAHTHTVTSGHAFSTLLENVEYAQRIGLKILGTTDHGPKMHNETHESFFNNYRVLPREIFGVTMLYGCEANIMSYEGELDISEKTQKKMDIIIASAHEPTLDSGTIEENTMAYLNAMDNPYVDIIGHCGTPFFPIYQEEVIKKAKEKNILIEINNSSFIGSRVGGEKNCIKIAELCKTYNVKIILNSDAHICFSIGNFDASIDAIKGIGMPEELIINGNPKEFIEFLQSKGKVLDIDTNKIDLE